MLPLVASSRMGERGVCMLVRSHIGARLVFWSATLILSQVSLNGVAWQKFT